MTKILLKRRFQEDFTSAEGLANLSIGEAALVNAGGDKFYIVAKFPTTNEAIEDDEGIYGYFYGESSTDNLGGGGTSTTPVSYTALDFNSTDAGTYVVKGPGSSITDKGNYFLNAKGEWKVITTTDGDSGSEGTDTITIEVGEVEDDKLKVTFNGEALYFENRTDSTANYVTFSKGSEGEDTITNTVKINLIDGGTWSNQ